MENDINKILILFQKAEAALKANDHNQVEGLLLQALNEIDYLDDPFDQDELYQKIILIGAKSHLCEFSESLVGKIWDDQLKFHNGHYWPQFFILQDLLQNPNLKQPQIDPKDYIAKSEFQKIKSIFLKT